MKKVKEDIDYDLVDVLAKDIFWLGDIAFIIKEINGPFLHASTGFYQIMKDFIKVKNVAGKKPSEVFLKNCLPQMENESDFLKSKNHKSLNELVFNNNKKKFKSFLCIKFRIKNLPPTIKTDKKLLGIIISDSINLEFQKNTISSEHFQATEFSKLIKSIKKITRFDEQNQNGDKKKLKKVIQQIENLSSRDFLTNLYNRHAFEEIMKLEIKKSIRYNFSVSLLVVDIDDFKRVNDNYGHICGDEILKELSKIFISSLRETDYICRWGGEEFTVILPKCNLEDAEQTAKKLLDNIRNQVFKPTKITVSIGVAQLKLNENMTSWFIRADNALLLAKREGKDQVVVCQR